MKKLIFFVILISTSLLLANPIIPAVISEIFFEGDNWTLEIYDYYQIFELYDLDDCCLTTSTDTAYFNLGITFNENGVFVVDEYDLQSSLVISSSGDTIILQYDEIFIYDEISFGNLVNPPTAEQSLARIVLYYGPPIGGEFFLLVKENQPTLGTDPFSVSSYGTFTGYVYDSLMNPVENVQLEYSPGLGYNGPDITTDEAGHFNANLPGMNYEFDIHLAALASLDTTITIEPDSVHYFEFVFENYVVGVDDPEIVISSQNYHLSNHPNPFNPSTTISFDLTAKNAQVEIYNSKGQKVDKLSISNGQSSITWEADNFPSGVYLYKLVIGGKEMGSNKMLLLK